jgi:hypothetical protein
MTTETPAAAEAVAKHPMWCDDCHSDPPTDHGPRGDHTRLRTLDLLDYTDAVFTIAVQAPVNPIMGPDTTDGDPYVEFTATCIDKMQRFDTGLVRADLVRLRDLIDRAIIDLDYAVWADAADVVNEGGRVR